VVVLFCEGEEEPLFAVDELAYYSFRGVSDYDAAALPFLVLQRRHRLFNVVIVALPLLF
jgi:hypothetical protein